MAGELWTAADVARLRQELQSREPDWRDVAAALGRTERAVRAKAKRLGLVHSAHPHYTSHGLALLLGCNRRQVDTWRQAGWLRPLRPHSAGPFSRQAVRRFLVAHPEVIGPQADKRWLVETLAGGSDRRTA